MMGEGEGEYAFARGLDAYGLPVRDKGTALYIISIVRWHTGTAPFIMRLLTGADRS